MSAIYEFGGKIVTVGKTENLGKDPSKPFKKRLVVIDGASEDDKYPNPVPFEATGDKCALLDSYRKGNEVTVKFAINGRAWTDKQGQMRYFGSNRIISIKKEEVAEIEIPTVADDGSFDDVDEMPF